MVNVQNYLLTLQPNWKTGPWSNCTALSPAAGGGNATTDDEEAAEGSGDDGLGGQCPGILLRNVYCEQIVGSGLAAIVQEDMCTSFEEKPDQQKSCDSDDIGDVESSEPRVINLQLKYFLEKNMTKLVRTDRTLDLFTF
jgi:hypothetical protein